MTTVGEKLKHELRELIPVTVLFFGTFRELVHALCREGSSSSSSTMGPDWDAEREANQP
jgi:hypothetical protein